MKTGNPNNYPFDSYDSFIIITASTIATNNDPSNDLPLTVLTQSAVQGFIYSTQFLGSPDGSTVLINFNIRRSTTTRIFSGVIFFRECARLGCHLKSPLPPKLTGMHSYVVS